jgi:hypothetical protein
MPGTTRLFPSVVFEIAVSNEDRERLLKDADEKYFSESTSVQAWWGVKLDITTPGEFCFWSGWGTRSLSGAGLRLEQQSEDEDGSSTFFPLHTDVAISQTFQILANLFYHPLPVPAGRPRYFVVDLENLRESLEYGVSIM